MNIILNICMLNVLNNTSNYFYLKIIIKCLIIVVKTIKDGTYNIYTIFLRIEHILKL